ncbi:hypothetical protein HYH03_006814 [Edaphochlamys debaryana]|uniref:Tubulin--tyrosine ligase-like protein 9 n=1 Tax=Edaphochlamys debaryana TaxID=47281 RepID=A0A836C144_9CHLO|nr:hypothetical protein HYH03_006814 [Edaphochlamys debaryana]|eukprot:KAG2495208.1 hypothetical protein HYH03_006814 [Edaphochlamys debaryana]
MLEIYEVFDLNNDELVEQLASLEQQLRAATSIGQQVQLKLLHDTVKQELVERGVSNRLYQQLAPAPPPPPPQPIIQQAVQPVAALYSFGSFGGGGGGGGHQQVVVVPPPPAPSHAPGHAPHAAAGHSAHHAPQPAALPTSPRATAPSHPPARQPQPPSPAPAPPPPQPAVPKSPAAATPSRPAAPPDSLIRFYDVPSARTPVPAPAKPAPPPPPPLARVHSSSGDESIEEDTEDSPAVTPSSATALAAAGEAGAGLMSPGAESSSAAAAGEAPAAPPTKQLTPWEASMLAFQEEQRKLRKARKAIRKGPQKPTPRKPSAVLVPHAPHAAPSLAAEASHGSNCSRPGGRPPRPSASGSIGAPSPGPRSAQAHPPTHVHAHVGQHAAGHHEAVPGRGPGAAGASSPHGAAALAAGSSVAGRTCPVAGAKPAGTGGVGAAAGGARAASAAPTGGSVPAGAAAGAAGTGGKASSANGAPPAAPAPPPKPSSAPPSVPAAVAAAAAAKAAAKAPAAAVAPPPVAAWAEADVDGVPEEHGLAARAEPERQEAAAAAAAAAANRLRVPSAPESVQTDEESSDVLAATMHEAAEAAAAARAAAGSGTESDTDSVPESISSDAAPDRKPVKPQPSQQPPAKPWSAPNGAGGAGAAKPAAAAAAPARIVSSSSSSSDGDESEYESDGGDGFGSPSGRGGKTAAQRVEDEEETRRRDVAAAARAAIQGRSAAEPGVVNPGLAVLARAAANAGPALKVDRWADWDLAGPLGPEGGDSLSAWATNPDDDPMLRGHLAGLRAAGAGPHQAPPESLVQGPTGAHGLAVAPQHGPSGAQHAPHGAAPPGAQHGATAARGSGLGIGTGGGWPLSRPGSRATAAATATEAGSSRAGSASSGGGGGGRGDRRGSSSSSSGESDSDAPAPVSAAPTPARPKPPSPLPRSGVVPKGASPAAAVASASSAPAAVATAAAPAAPAVPSAPSPSPPSGPANANGTGSPAASGGPGAPRRPPLAPSAAAQASPPPSLPPKPGLPRGGSSGSLSTSAEPNPAAAYLQHFGAFQEIFTACYTGAPATALDTAALAAAAAAGGAAAASAAAASVSRPSSRMAGSGGAAAAAAAAASLDLGERYASLLARCEAWQAKLRQMAAAAPSPPSRAPPTPPPPTPSASSSPSAPASSPAAATATATAQLPKRYVAVFDDTAHPEVREVVMAALRLLEPSGWALDPADQVTEPAKPDTNPDDPDPGGGAGGGGGSGPNSGASSLANTRPSTAASASILSGGGPGSGGGGGGGRCHLWNVLWSWSVKTRAPAGELLTWQRVNHYAEARQLTRKDLLKKHLARYQAMHNTGRSAALFDRLTPTTFVLPKEAAAFEEAYVRALHGVEPTCVQPMGLNLWIQKPVGLSRGRGISLLNSVRQVNTEEPMVVQRYLTDPLLVHGHKFDLRLYVLVTSFNPLEAWMHEEGFARFTTLPYTLDESQLDNMHVHLTNSSVQKTRAEAGLLPDFLKAADPPGGSKTSLATLRRLLSGQGVDWALLWGRIAEVATATLYAAQDAIPHSPNAFELYGFDVMIDAEQKVWLLEVNSSPSMGLDTPLDRATKPRLIADVLELLAPLAFDREALAGVLRARAATGRGSRRGAAGLLSGTVSEEREWCCADLQAVLGGNLPRRYGEKPRQLGGFKTCLAPSPFHDRLLKLRRPLPG